MPADLPPGENPYRARTPSRSGRTRPASPAATRRPDAALPRQVGAHRGLLRALGAGKSSLLNARLIPGLRREGLQGRAGGARRAVPPAGLTPPTSSPSTPCGTWLGSSRPRDPRRAAPSIPSSVPSRARGRKGPPRVLIFDQFEEILTTHADRWPQRKEFFLQLRQALRTNSLAGGGARAARRSPGRPRAYAPQLPASSATRFRWRSCGRTRPWRRSRRPAEQAAGPFARGRGAAGGRPLPRARLRPGGAGDRRTRGAGAAPGRLLPAVEEPREPPRRRGQRRSPPGRPGVRQRRGGARAVPPRHGAEGRRGLRPASGAPAQLVRDPPDHTSPRPHPQPGPAEAAATGGLPNAGGRLADESHLVRRLDSRGGKWCELAHDRFIDPILRSDGAPSPQRPASWPAGPASGAGGPRPQLPLPQRPAGEALRWSAAAAGDARRRGAGPPGPVVPAGGRRAARRTRHLAAASPASSPWSRCCSSARPARPPGRAGPVVPGPGGRETMGASCRCDPERSLDLIQRRSTRARRPRRRGPPRRILDGQADQFRRGRSFRTLRGGGWRLRLQPRRPPLRGGRSGGRRRPVGGQPAAAACCSRSAAMPRRSAAPRSAPTAPRVATGDAAGRVLLRSAAGHHPGAQRPS